ncbi:MAG: ATP-binding cassette domain-containing protein [Sulfolobus sp.]|nr:ATP-binding cassette domain-containing protein [Sulfolobus sp.]
MTLEFQNVKVSYEDKVVIKDANLRVSSDRKVVLLGPNGAGKTTIIKAVCGMIPYEGKIYVDGQEVRRLWNYTQLSTNLSDAYTLASRVKSLAEIYLSLKDGDIDLFLSMIKEAKMEDVLDKVIYKLSAGQSVIVRNALALSSRPKIALMDEPFENVDPARRSIIVRWLKEYAEEVLFVTHEIDILKSFKSFYTYFLIDGRVWGPMSVSDFLESSIVEGRVPDALLTLSVMGKDVSIVKGKGVSVLSLGSLDRIYGVMNFEEL